MTTTDDRGTADGKLTLAEVLESFSSGRLPLKFEAYDGSSAGPEDAELGLRLMKAGLQTRYIDRVMGRGLTPDSFNGFKKQRRRWAAQGKSRMRI